MRFSPKVNATTEENAAVEIQPVGDSLSNNLAVENNSQGSPMVEERNDTNLVLLDSPEPQGPPQYKVNTSNFFLNTLD